MLVGDIHIRNNERMYTYNNSIIYSKDTLQQIVSNEESRIVTNVVKSITYGILYEAEHAKKTYEWKDTNNILNEKLYERVFNEIIIKFPDINIEEFGGYAITFNWQ